MKDRVFKYFMQAIFIASIFHIGRIYGYRLCQNKFIEDYRYQSKQIDSLQNRTILLKSTYDSIKKSPCFKQNTKK